MKRRTIASIAALTLVAATAGGVASAQRGQGPGPGGPGGFNLLEFDTNADGKLARQEFDAALRVRFNEFDANKDGVASAEEMKTARQAKMKTVKAERFAKLDKDGDGKLTRAELEADGMGPGMGSRGGPGGPGVPGGPGGMRGPGPRGMGDGGPPGDADGNGSLTFAEFSARPTEAFTRADANSDGTVTISELQALRPTR